MRNKILIIVDDLAPPSLPWSGVEGHAISSPVLEALRMLGQEYEFYTMPSCRPTRASILTGLMPFQHGIGESAEAQTHEIDPSLDTLPKSMQRLGYRTYFVGKWHLCPQGLDWTDHPQQYGFDRSIHTEGNTGDYYNSEWSWDGERTQVPGRYLTDLLEPAVHDLLQGPVPFFLWLAPHAVHNPIHDPPGYEGPDDDLFRYKAAAEYLMDTLAVILARFGKGSDIYICSDNGAPVDVSISPPRHRKGSLAQGGIRNWLIKYPVEQAQAQPPRLACYDLGKLIRDEELEGSGYVFSQKFKGEFSSSPNDQRAVYDGQYKLRCQYVDGVMVEEEFYEPPDSFQDGDPIQPPVADQEALRAEMVRVMGS